MTTILPVEPVYDDRDAVRTGLQLTPSARESLRRKLMDDMKRFFASGGKVEHVEAGVSGDTASHQAPQTMHCNAMRSKKAQELSSKQAKYFRILKDNADANGFVCATEVYRTIEGQIDRGNFYAYVHKLHEKGYLRRGAKKGYYKITGQLPSCNTVKGERV